MVEKLSASSIWCRSGVYMPPVLGVTFICFRVLSGCQSKYGRCRGRVMKNVRSVILQLLDTTQKLCFHSLFTLWSYDRMRCVHTQYTSTMVCWDTGWAPYDKCPFCWCEMYMWLVCEPLFSFPLITHQGRDFDHTEEASPGLSSQPRQLWLLLGRCHPEFWRLAPSEDASHSWNSRPERCWHLLRG